jgi:hydrogenase maturation protease
MLSAPIILSDYPRVAPESPGDFFDGTEVDELLTLRVLTLTDEEKREVRTAGHRARALLDRTEGLSEEQMLRLHGAVRSPAPSIVRPGARVRLRPHGRSDAMDLILSGKAATVVAVERDYEGRLHLAVTVDEDPGQDLGRLGRPGHRFFFRPEEVEPLNSGSGETP